MTYNEVLEELRAEFSRIGDITINDRGIYGGKNAGKLLRNYTDKMIEIAQEKLTSTEADLEFSKAVRLFINELENKHITITIKETK